MRNPELNELYTVIDGPLGGHSVKYVGHEKFRAIDRSTPSLCHYTDYQLLPTVKNGGTAEARFGDFVWETFS